MALSKSLSKSSRVALAYFPAAGDAEACAGLAVEALPVGVEGAARGEGEGARATPLGLAPDIR